MLRDSRSRVCCMYVYVFGMKSMMVWVDEFRLFDIWRDIRSTYTLYIRIWRTVVHTAAIGYHSCRVRSRSSAYSAAVLRITGRNAKMAERCTHSTAMHFFIFSLRLLLCLSPSFLPMALFMLFLFTTIYILECRINTLDGLGRNSNGWPLWELLFSDCFSFVSIFLFFQFFRRTDLWCPKSQLIHAEIYA